MTKQKTKHYPTKLETPHEVARILRDMQTNGTDISEFIELESWITKNDVWYVIAQHPIIQNRIQIWKTSKHIRDLSWSKAALYVLPASFYLKTIQLLK